MTSENNENNNLQTVLVPRDVAAKLNEKKKDQFIKRKVKKNESDKLSPPSTNDRCVRTGAWDGRRGENIT